MLKHAFSFFIGLKILKMENKRDSFFLHNKKKNSHEINKEFKNTDGENSKRKDKQIEFDKNRPGLPEPAENGKKPFDKKTYRLKKYSKKYKLEQWEELRKKRLLHEYQKSVKNDPMVGTYKPKTFDEDTPDSAEVGRFVKHPDLLEKELNDQKVKKVPFAKAKEQFSKVKEEKLLKQQEKDKAREERMQKLQEYKKKKQEKFKKLSKKTKKGQPVMSGRMELLLERIKASK